MFQGGSKISLWGRGHQPPIWVLFGKTACENERIGSGWGGMMRVEKCFWNHKISAGVYLNGMWPFFFLKRQVKNWSHNGMYLIKAVSY